MTVWAGTSGYSFDEWKGWFYPEALPAKERLRYYAERLPAVEINNTFYRMPKAPVLESWAAQVPEGFRFVIKASQRITHIKRLRDCGELLGFLTARPPRSAPGSGRSCSSFRPTSARTRRVSRRSST